MIRDCYDFCCVWTCYIAAQRSKCDAMLLLEPCKPPRTLMYDQAHVTDADHGMEALLTTSERRRHQACSPRRNAPLCIYFAVSACTRSSSKVSTTRNASPAWHP
jgi:hypothetical protein